MTYASYASMSLDELADLRYGAKHQEDVAIADRRAIDAEIAKRMKSKDEGTVSAEHGGFKVSVTYGLSRKVDSDALTSAWLDMSENLQKCFRWEAKVSKRELDAVRDLTPAAYAAVAKYITTTESAPSVKVESLTKE